MFECWPLMKSLRLTTRLGLIEFCNGYQNIGHNTFGELFFLWIIPKYVYAQFLIH
jgi:hypothetical protein